MISEAADAAATPEVVVSNSGGNNVDFGRSHHYRGSSNYHPAPMGTMHMSSEADESSTGDDLDANDLQ